MRIIKDTQIQLNNLQNHVIGLFKPFYSDKIELVLSYEDGVVYCVTVGALGGLSETHIPDSKGKLVMFEEGMSLWDLMQNPFKLDELCKTIK